MRNDGPDAVSVAQAVVNDAFAQFTGADAPIGRLETATVRITQPWVEGESYEIALVTSTGGTIVHEIPVAVETPVADAGFFGLMALLGVYVGVIPVALGMLWLPWLRRVPPAWLRALMGLTIGLLAFLAVDAAFEGFELAARGLAGVRRRGAGVRRRGGRLSAAERRVGVAVEAGRRRFGLLAGAADRDRHRPAQPRRGRGHRRRPTRRARWRWARSWSSASRSTTRPRAWRSSRRSRRPRRRCGRLALLGLIAGAPAVLGAWIGAGAYNASIAAFLFGFGAGAIIQVVVTLLPSLRDDDGRTLHPAAVTGILGGMAVMFLTGLLVAA